MQEGVGLALVGARNTVHALDALDDSGYSVCDTAGGQRELRGGWVRERRGGGGEKE